MLPVEAFQTSSRPVHEMAVGIRLISQRQVETARAEAAKYAIEMHDKPDDSAGRQLSYEDRLMVWIGAQSACDPNDRAKTQFTPDELPERLTPEGLRFLFDNYEALSIELSPLWRPIDDAGVARLARAVERGALGRLEHARALRARKLLAFVLAELEEAPTVTPDELVAEGAIELVREAQAITLPETR